jgi:Ca2+-binding RTX toxin-like protein
MTDRRLFTLVAALATGLALLGSSAAVAWPTCDGQPATITGSGTIFGTIGDDVIVGSAGNDVIKARAGFDRVCGGGGDDVIYGGDGTNYLWGEDGNDRLIGGVHYDRLFGGAGNDILNPRVGPASFVNAGPGADRIIVYAGTGHDLRGYTGRDTLDLRNAPAAASGPGYWAVWVEYDYINNVHTITWDVPGGPPQAYQGIDAGRAVGIERMLGSSHDDGLEGTAGMDVLKGNAGADRLYGYAGNDRLLGGDGSDDLYASDGDDYLDGGNHYDRISPGGGDDTCVNWEFNWDPVNDACEH